MEFSARLSEERIKASIEKGEFSNLRGAGKPLVIENDSMIPDELRMGYKIMKNAGFLPEELQLKKEMITLKELLSCCDDENEQTELKEKLSQKALRFHQLAEQRKFKNSKAYHAYSGAVKKRLF
ncbi:DUF1992 domain-containing protein [Thalassobacillus sp. C254]|uniref:DnaJ family domain-containing protein n=1 Tax=Thalassobacillus sp. C254 TaxID=1225341 RepID=UPI0006CFC036|nr:DUF1992 domain-containing protein [Thalassobacillus sp. C254]